MAAGYFTAPLPLKGGGLGLGLLPEQSKQQRQDDADDDGGGEGKIKGKILFSNDKISRQLP
jgi:hypothetical protein